MLHVHSPGVLAHLAIRTHHSVAGHHNRQRVFRARGTRRPRCTRQASIYSKLGVGGGVRVRDALQCLLHLHIRTGGLTPIQRELKLAALPRKVLCQLCCHIGMLPALRAIISYCARKLVLAQHDFGQTVRACNAHNLPDRGGVGAVGIGGHRHRAYASPVIGLWHT